MTREEARIILEKGRKMHRITTVLGSGWRAFPRARAMRLLGSSAAAIGLILISRFLAGTIFAGEIFREVGLGGVAVVTAFIVLYCGIGRWIPSRGIRLFTLAAIVAIATLSLAEVFRVWPPSGMVWLTLGLMMVCGLFGLASAVAGTGVDPKLFQRWILPVRAVCLFFALANYWSASQWPPGGWQGMANCGFILLIFDALLAGTAEDTNTGIGNVAPIYLDLVLLLVYFAA